MLNVFLSSLIELNGCLLFESTAVVRTVIVKYGAVAEVFQPVYVTVTKLRSESAVKFPSESGESIVGNPLWTAYAVEIFVSIE